MATDDPLGIVLLERLQCLLDSQFETVLLLCQVKRADLPSAQSPLTLRATALIQRMAQLSDGLETLDGAIERVMSAAHPGAPRNSAPSRPSPTPPAGDVARWDPRRDVLIAHGVDGARKLLGSGTLIAPGIVLTARHVVVDSSGAERSGLYASRAAEDQGAEATVRWTGGEDLDIAVLHVIANDSWNVPHIPLRPRHVASGESWETRGFPTVRREAPRVQQDAAGGTTRSCYVNEKTLLLDVNASPEVWQGMSGAAVVIGDEIVGVLRAVREGWNGKRLAATALWAFYQNQEFLAAIGGATRSRRTEDVLQTLVAQLAGCLQRAAVLSAVRAQFPSTAGSADELAHALVHRDIAAVDLAFGLFKAHEALYKMGGPDAAQNLDAVWRMLMHLLPYAGDWDEVVEAQRDAMQHNARVLELPFRSIAITEAVMAGVHDRSCDFVVSEEGGSPQGAAMIRVPGAAEAFIDPSGKRLKDLVVNDIAAKLPEIIARRIVDRLKVRPDTQELHDVLAAVEGKLRADLRADKRHYYLVFLESEYCDRPDRTQLWSLSSASLLKAFPSLTFTLLTGDANAAYNEIQEYIGRMMSPKKPS